MDPVVPDDDDELFERGGRDRATGAEVAGQEGLDGVVDLPKVDVAIDDGDAPECLS